MPTKSESMMTLAIHDQRLTKPGPQNAALRDYDSVRRAIAFISEHWRAQPTIEAMADAASVTPDELHHLFRRCGGRTPKGLMRARGGGDHREFSAGADARSREGPVAPPGKRARRSPRLGAVRSGPPARSVR